MKKLLCGLRTHRDVTLNGTNGISNRNKSSEATQSSQLPFRLSGNGIVERPRRSLPVKVSEDVMSDVVPYGNLTAQVTTISAANGRHTASKPLSAGPSSPTSKRPKRGVKPEPQEILDMHSKKIPAQKVNFSDFVIIYPPRTDILS